MGKKSKKDLILIHLQMHGSITSWEAIQKFRATRLSAVIHTLRDEGHNITSTPEQNKESGTNYSRYKLHMENANKQFSLL